MKKIIVSLVLLFTVGLTNAQGFDIGLKLGYNSSLSFKSLNSDLSYNYKNVFNELWNGFQVGAYGRLYFNKTYVQPELLYSRNARNYTVTLDNGVGSYDNVVKLNSIDIPILLGYKLVDAKLIKFRAFAGPIFRFNVGSSIDFKNQSVHLNSDDFKEEIKDARVGLQAGIGVDILAFSLDVRYNLIGDMYKTTFADIKKDGFPPSTFIFSLGWKIL